MPEKSISRIGNEKLKITSDRLLLVEGRDDYHLLIVLIRDGLDDESDIQVIDVGGKGNFPENLQAIRTQVRTRTTFRSLGVVLDADDNPEGIFKSICDNLRNAGFDPPKSHGEFSESSPSVGVFIVPDGIECGAMETLCRKSLADSVATECVEQYLECLVKSDAMESNNADKSFAHAYLASKKNPVARVGEGARQGIWDFKSAAFEGLLNFIRVLSSQGK